MTDNQTLPPLVTTLTEAIDNIDGFLSELDRAWVKLNQPEAYIVKMLSRAQSWYAIEYPDGTRKFAPAKFIGYVGLTVEIYNDQHVELNGSATERVLSRWGSPLEPHDRRYHAVMADLEAFCAKYGQRPNVRCRVSMLRDPRVKTVTAPSTTPAQDSMDALWAYLQTLPPDVFAELRRRFLATPQ